MQDITISYKHEPITRLGIRSPAYVRVEESVAGDSSEQESRERFKAACNRLFYGEQDLNLVVTVREGVAVPQTALPKEQSRVISKQDVDIYKYQKPLEIYLYQKFPGIVILQWGNKFFFVYKEISGKFIKLKHCIKYKVEYKDQAVKGAAIYNSEIFKVISKMLESSEIKEIDEWIDS